MQLLRDAAPSCWVHLLSIAIFVHSYHQSPEKWAAGTTPVPMSWAAGIQYDGDTYRANQVSPANHFRQSTPWMSDALHSVWMNEATEFGVRHNY